IRASTTATNAASRHVGCQPPLWAMKIARKKSTMLPTAIHIKRRKQPVIVSCLLGVAVVGSVMVDLHRLPGWKHRGGSPRRRGGGGGAPPSRPGGGRPPPAHP